MTMEKRKAIHTSPPAMLRDWSAVGLKAKLKITTTSSEKKSMEFRTSRERHSSRRSLATFTHTSLVMDMLFGGVSAATRFPVAALMLLLPASVHDPPALRARAKEIRRPDQPAVRPDV